VTTGNGGIADGVVARVAAAQHPTFACAHLRWLEADGVHLRYQPF
jgi:hypothetical protein